MILSKIVGSSCLFNVVYSCVMFVKDEKEEGYEQLNEDEEGGYISKIYFKI